jgi:NADP-dependent 3-hydroxy acid dehydrogenase YdfG
VLVNNAGVDWAGFLEDQDPQGLQQMIQVNLYAALRLAQLVLPGMLARNYGHIVNVSGSTAG